MTRKELFIFIIVISLVAFILLTYLMLSFFTGSQNPGASPSIPPSPLRSSQPVRVFDNSPLPQTTPTPSPSNPGQITKDVLINSLPLRTTLFNIEYYFTDDLFRVTIKENPYSENKLKAEQWFIDRGFDPSSLNIFWDAYPEVERPQ